MGRKYRNGWAAIALSALCAGWVGTSHAGKIVPYSFGGHMYLIVDDAVAWTQANAQAVSVHGHLMIISSEAENQFIFTNLLNESITTVAPDGGGAKYTWIGGTDAVIEGDWRWVDNAVMSGGFTKWGSGGFGSEPDNFGGNQHCAAMGLEGWPTFSPGGFGNASQWNDVDCENSLAYVIEFDDPMANQDGDALYDWEEFIAGTDPDSSNSVHEVSQSSVSNATLVLQWSSVVDRSYDVLITSNLLIEVWSTQATCAGTGGMISHTVTPMGAQAAIRVDVTADP